VAAAADASKSNVVTTSGNWEQQCMTSSITRRAPFDLIDIHVQVRDFFGNKKQLGPGETLTLAVYRAP